MSKRQPTWLPGAETCSDCGTYEAGETCVAHTPELQVPRPAPPPAKDDLPVTTDTAFYIHYCSYDPQGGFWPVTPKGPYTNLNEARAVAYRMKQNREKNRKVRLVLRTETELSIVGGTWPI